MRPPRRGYTLFELVLVIAVLAAVAALAYPSVEAMYGNYRVTAAVDQVRAAWAAARAHALEEGRPYRFGVVPDGGNIRVAPDGGEFWGGGGASLGDGGGDAYVQEESLPKGVRVSLSANGAAGPVDDGPAPGGDVPAGGWTTAAVFLPDGTARDDAELLFRARGSRPVSLRLRALTGIVTGRPLAP
jgi:prepilin-type N-terminal cleavage/methylation domain-containing protein